MNHIQTCSGTRAFPSSFTCTQPRTHVVSHPLLRQSQTCRPRSHRRHPAWSHGGHQACNVACQATLPLRESEEKPQQQQDPRTMGGKLRWWEDLEQEQQGQEEDFSLLTPEEVEERVDDAAGLISMLEDMRPLNPRGFNAFEEVWARVARIPPHARAQLVQEVEPGGIRSLWRASMSRYVLDDTRVMALLQAHPRGTDWPTQPGQVVTYVGRCERIEVQPGVGKLTIDQAKQTGFPNQTLWLRPTPGSVALPQKHFTAHLFLHPRTAHLHARITLPLGLGMERWWEPAYCRVTEDLTVTPLESDAGADLTFDFPNMSDQEQWMWWGLGAEAREGGAGDGEGGEGVGEEGVGGVSRSEGEVQGGWEEGAEGGDMRWRQWHLTSEDVPVKGWPAPTLDMWSPFSQTGRDYVRVAGPGVYVGCGYTPGPDGIVNKDDCVYFMMVKKD